MALLRQILSLLLAFWDAWKALLSARDASLIRENEEKRQERERAIEDQEKAESEEDIWDAQKRIVKNKP